MVEGIPETTMAKTGVKTENAEAKYPMPVPPRRLVRGIDEKAIAAVRPKLEQWSDPITDIDASVCDTVRRLRANPYLPSSLTIYGMVIHPHTGEIRVVDDGEGQEQEVL